MLHTSTHLNKQRVQFSHQWARVFLYLSFGLLLPGVTYAQDNPSGNEIQIQQTLNQLLGEEQAKLYKKIIPIIQKENNKPYMLDLMEQWLNDAYHEHPDSKPGLLQVRKKLRNQKGGR